MHIVLACSFLLAPYMAAAQGFGNADQKIGLRSVSLVSLIATPESFHGQKVRVIGAFNVAFEDNVLCLHMEDLVNRISANCVWHRPDYESLRTTRNGLSVLNGRYVLVEGTYDMHRKGHFDCCAGEIGSVTRVEALRNYER